MTLRSSWLHRLAIFITSLIVITVELALMRELALRFWEHLAWLVISIALLGFGTSGTLLVLIHSFFPLRQHILQFVSLVCFALSLPASLWLTDCVDLNLIQMVWQPSLFWKVGSIELALGMPFVFAGMYIGLALEDIPERVPGNYSASFLGSGSGGLITLPLLYLLSPRLLIICCSGIVLILALLHARTPISRLSWMLSVFIMVAVITFMPSSPRVANDKDLPQLQAMPNSAIMASLIGPQGTVTVIDAPSLHMAPGMALTAQAVVPPQYQILIDGQIAGALYLTDHPEEFAFLDYTTMALPYHIENIPDVLLASDPGSDHTGLAIFHKAQRIEVLSDNNALTTLKHGKTGNYNGYPYQEPEVSLTTTTVRGYLHSSPQTYSLIVLPTVGSDSGGLSAVQPESTITLESFELCLSRLTPAGFLAITTYIHSPPRESLRLFNMLVEVIRKAGGNPVEQIAMIRNWSTVTLVAANAPFSPGQLEKIRAFCNERGFDLVWLAGLKPDEVNLYHQLDIPHYFQGAEQLMGSGSKMFVSRYVYDLSIVNDNIPFFNSFGRWQGLQELTAQMGRRGRAFIELGSFLLVIALCQTVILAFVFILLPLAPAIGLPGNYCEQGAVLLVCTSLGLGFMLLEMALLQRLTVYLAEPLWAAATVLSGVLSFGGVGSALSSNLPAPLRKTHFLLALSLVFTGILLLFTVDLIIDATEKFATPVRVFTALALIAPLSTLMGMLFPLVIKRLGKNQPMLIPWAWAVNGYGSVVATLLTPLLALKFGFLPVSVAALSCYILAAFGSLMLPDSS